MLVHGVSWDPAGPALSLTTDGGGVRLPLVPGQWLRFKALAGVGVPARYCLGYTTVQGPEESQHHRCPTGQGAERGFQCGACFAKDELRYMHDFHRSGIAPAGMRRYLAQPHWLYVATFADGTTKVGTASQRSKWSRLADQGAIAAQYVARAQDGSVVRLLEDMVSKGLGVTQFVRAANKSAALLSPRPTADLGERNQGVAAGVRDLLDEQTLAGFETITETWEGSSFSAAISVDGQRIAYPQPLDSGAHGMRLDSMLGANALVVLDGVDVACVVDLGTLKGHKISLGEYVTEIPALQESLF